MSELPSGATGGAAGGLDGRPEPPRVSPNGGVQRRVAGELTPAELAVRRRNRRRIGAIAIPAAILGGLALVASILAGTGSSGPSPLDVPAGYQAITDGVFAYAVPSPWVQAAAYTDDVGDLATEGTTGWVGEHLGVRAVAPVPGETPPPALEAFGEPSPMPYRLSPPTRTAVNGTTLAYRYVMTRPGGFNAVTIDAWQAGTEVELWIVIHADGPTTGAILSSLRG